MNCSKFLGVIIIINLSFFPKDAENDSGVDESTQRGEVIKVQINQLYKYQTPFELISL